MLDDLGAQKPNELGLGQRVAPDSAIPATTTNRPPSSPPTTPTCRLGLVSRSNTKGNNPASDFNNLLSVILSYTEFALERAQKGDPLWNDLWR